MTTSDTSPSPRPRRRSAIEASGASSRTNTRRPLCTLAAASVSDSTWTMRARTSSPSTLACKRHQHVGAAFEQVAILAEALLEDDRLVLAAGVGKLDDAELVAGLGAPLVAVDARWRRAAPSVAPPRTARDEVGPARRAQPLQRRHHRLRADGRRGRSRPPRIRAAAGRRPARLRRATLSGARPRLRRTGRSGPPPSPRRRDGRAPASARSRRRRRRGRAPVRRRRRRRRGSPASSC